MKARESFFSQPMTRYRRTQRMGDYLMLLCVWLGACWLGWVVITAILAKRVMEGERGVCIGQSDNQTMRQGEVKP
jgi:hypothetical protein